MFVTPEHRNGAPPEHDSETAEAPIEAIRHQSNGQVHKLRHKAIPAAPLPRHESPLLPEGPVLAVFCYEDPASGVGRFMIHMAAALAQRKTNVHVFSRKGFDPNA